MSIAPVVPLSCTNTLVTLTASASMAGGAISAIAWSRQGEAGLLSISESLTTNTAGTYIVSVTASNGCVATAQVSLTGSSASPDATISMSGSLISCSTSGRVYLSVPTGASQYQWTSSNGYFANRRDIEVTTAGTYSVTVTNASGCTATAQVVVPAAPNTLSVSISASHTAICTGGLPVTLTAVPSLTTSFVYRWNTPMGDYLPSFTTTTPGVYSVTAVRGTSCSATASITLVSGSSAVTVVVPTAAVNGAPLSLTAQVDPQPASASYAWSGPANFTATQTTPILSFSAGTTALSGAYTVLVTLPGGCTATGTGSLTVGIPAATTLNECDIRIVAKDAQNKETTKLPRTAPQSLTLSVESLDGTSLTGYTYQWTRSISTSAGATTTAQGSSPTLSATAIGEYKVTVSGTDNKTCVAYLTLSRTLCQTVNQTYQCGTRPATPVGTPGSPPLTNLAPGDTIRTGDFDVVVTQVTGGGASGWTGKGYTEIPYLKNGRIAVELNSAVVNDCYELVSGTVVSAYDPAWGGVRSVDQAVDQARELLSRVSDLIATYTGTSEQKTALQAAGEQLCNRVASTASTLPDVQSQQLTGACQTFQTNLATFLACTVPTNTTATAGARIATVVTSCLITQDDLFEDATDLEKGLTNTESLALTTGTAEDAAQINTGAISLSQVMDVCQQAVRWKITPVPNLINNTQVTIDGITYIALCRCTQKTGDCAPNGLVNFVKVSAYEALKSKSGNNRVNIKDIDPASILPTVKYSNWINATAAKAFLQSLVALNIPNLDNQKATVIADLIGEMKGGSFELYTTLTTPLSATFTDYLYGKSTANWTLNDLEQALKTYQERARVLVPTLMAQIAKPEPVETVRATLSQFSPVEYSSLEAEERCKVLIYLLNQDGSESYLNNLVAYTGTKNGPALLSCLNANNNKLLMKLLSRQTLLATVATAYMMWGTPPKSPQTIELFNFMGASLLGSQAASNSSNRLILIEQEATSGAVTARTGVYQAAKLFSKNPSDYINVYFVNAFTIDGTTVPAHSVLPMPSIYVYYLLKEASGQRFVKQLQLSAAIIGTSLGISEWVAATSLAPRILAGTEIFLGVADAAMTTDFADNLSTTDEGKTFVKWYTAIVLSHGAVTIAPSIAEGFMNATARLLTKLSDPAQVSKIELMYNVFRQQYKLTKTFAELAQAKLYSGIFPFPDLLTKFNNLASKFVDAVQTATTVKNKVYQPGWTAELRAALQEDLKLTDNLLESICKDPDLIDIWKLLEKSPSLRKNVDKLKAFKEIKASQLLNEAELAQLTEKISQWKDQSRLLDNLVTEAKSPTRSSARLIALANRNEGLLTKLGDSGYQTLESWVAANKATVSSPGISVSDLNNLLKSLEDKLSGQTIIQMKLDGQGRFTVRCKGEKTSKVYSIVKNNTNEYKVRYYQNGYNPAESSFGVEISDNLLAPDFAKGPNAQTWLYPVTGEEKNIVRIKLTGKRLDGLETDFHKANIAAKIPYSRTGYAPDGYTWHHMDDFDPISGECTMQLVKQDVHGSTFPHTGSPAQYTDYTGLTYK